MRILSVLLLSVVLCFSTFLSAEDMVGPVNINTADASTLSAQLKGVGDSKAQAIIKYRETVGPFTSIEQLKNVKGIGDSLLDKNRDHIVLE